MANGGMRNARIVMMSPVLMKMYEVKGLNPALEFQPITFYDPQDCLEMLIHPEDGEPESVEEEAGPEFEKMEKRWGELELRLSFFTDSYKWH